MGLVDQPTANRSRDGFALIVVIWAIGGIALLFMAAITAARYRGVEAATLYQRARAGAAVEAGVTLAIATLLAQAGAVAGTGATSRPTGPAMRCRMPGGIAIAVAISNESGKVDLDSASPALLDALFRGALPGNRYAGLLARAVVRARGRTAIATVAADAPSAPPRQRFKSIVELGAIDGLTQADFASLAPLVTVHSRSPGVNQALASPPLLEALATGTGSTQARGGADLAAFFVAEAPGTMFQVSSEAVTSSGTRAGRDAIVEVAAGPPLTYRIREWREGSLHGAARLDPGLAPC